MKQTSQSLECLHILLHNHVCVFSMIKFWNAFFLITFHLQVIFPSLFQWPDSVFSCFFQTFVIGCCTMESCISFNIFNILHRNHISHTLYYLSSCILTTFMVQNSAIDFHYGTCQVLVWDYIKRIMSMRPYRAVCSEFSLTKLVYRIFVLFFFCSRRQLW